MEGEWRMMDDTYLLLFGVIGFVDYTVGTLTYLLVYLVSLLIFHFEVFVHK